MILFEETLDGKLPGETSFYVKFNYNTDLIYVLKNTVSVSHYDTKMKVWEIPTSDLKKLVNKFKYIDDIEIEVLEKPEEKQKRKIKLHEDQYKLQPYEYQREGIQESLQHDKFLLLDEMGLGKTPQAIHSAEERFLAGQIDHCLIICGVSSLRFNWLNEIKKHSNLSATILGMSAKGTLGGNKERLDHLKRKIDEMFVITNIETFRDDSIVKEFLNKKSKNKFDMVIFDEAHKAKNPSALQSKGVMKLKPKYFLVMTGTPIMNNPEDAFMSLKLIGAENCSFTNFKYYYEEFGGSFHNDLIGYRNMDVLKRMISDHSIRRLKRDVLDLPPKIIIDELVEMSPDHARFYNDIVDGITENVDLVNLSPNNILAMALRLRQATVAPSILSSEKIMPSKLFRAKDIIEEATANNNKVVVFSTFKQPLSDLGKLLKCKYFICTGDSKEQYVNKSIKDFQESDEPCVMLATHSKLGTGVTLTAANTEIFLDLPWTSALYEQAQDRCYRVGTRGALTIYNLMCKDTIDERVFDIVEQKKALSGFIIDNKILAESLRQYMIDL